MGYRILILFYTSKNVRFITFVIMDNWLFLKLLHINHTDIGFHCVIFVYVYNVLIISISPLPALILSSPVPFFLVIVPLLHPSHPRLPRFHIWKHAILVWVWLILLENNMMIRCATHFPANDMILFFMTE